jgi:hypothetical protein
LKKKHLATLESVPKSNDFLDDGTSAFANQEVLDQVLRFVGGSLVVDAAGRQSRREKDHESINKTK